MQGDVSYSPLDWWSFGLSIAGLVGTLIGFAIAICQIKKTASAANSAIAASVIGMKRIRYNQLLVIVPELQSVEPDLDSAVGRNDAYAAERALAHWRRVATQALGILRELDAVSDGLIDQVEVAVRSARNSKARLADADQAERKLITVVATARKELASATDGLNELVGRLSTELEPAESGAEK